MSGAPPPIDAIVRHQQPPGQAFFVLAAAVGQRCLRSLDEESVDAPQKRPVQTNTLVHGPAQLACADTLSGSCDLNVRVMGRAIMARHDRQAGHAFSPDDADLDAVLPSTIGDDRGKATLYEVDVVDAAIPGLQLGLDRKVDGHQVRLEQRKVCARQCRQVGVLDPGAGGISGIALPLWARAPAVSQPPAPEKPADDASTYCLHQQCPNAFNRYDFLPCAGDAWYSSPSERLGHVR